MLQACLEPNLLGSVCTACDHITSGSWQSWLARSSKLHAESSGCCHCPPEAKSPAHSRVALKGTVTLHGHMISATVPMDTSDQDRTWEEVLREVELAPQPSGRTTDETRLGVPLLNRVADNIPSDGTQPVL